MSENQELKLHELQEKISLLKSSFTVLLSQNKQLKQTNEQLELNLEDKKESITKLERNYKNLQLAKAVSDSSGSSGENNEAKKNIEKIVKEIDSCIALLNA